MYRQPDHEPIWAWQVLDGDGRWGTIAVMLVHSVSMITGESGANSGGHNLVLQSRSEKLARGPLKEFAEIHRRSGKPVRLVRYLPDPDFTPEELP